MQEKARYVVGVDIGTTATRCVVGQFYDEDDSITIVAANEVPGGGMRKGVVSQMTAVAQSVDDVLVKVESLLGHRLDSASASINGADILGQPVSGMVVLGAPERAVEEADIQRLEHNAAVGMVPENRKILETVSHQFTVNGQGGVKDPIDMVGSRLEMKGYVVSALQPHVTTIEKTFDTVELALNSLAPPALAAARVVLTPQQRDNGVALIDIGAATTGVAIFEGGDLQYLSVIPLGGEQITNDLAVGLQVEPGLAERIKREQGYATLGIYDEDDEDSVVEIKDGNQTLTFSRQEIDEIIGARLEEIFERIAKELKKSGLARRLPSGTVLIGGVSHMTGIVELAKSQLKLAARLGQLKDVESVIDGIDELTFAGAVGLMMVDSQVGQYSDEPATHGGQVASEALGRARGFFHNLIDRFKP